jgi:cobalt-zinc-cadmium efflux system outer membrane protein
LPPGLPGVEAPEIRLPVFKKDTPLAVRNAAIKGAFPRLPPPAPVPPLEGKPLTLAELQSIAAANSPTLRKVRAAAEAARGQFVQAGLFPNPTVGYQVDQWAPHVPHNPNSGQQGMFVNWLVKVANKVPLAQMVAGFDYINALADYRQAEITLVNQVRDRYFAVLVAREGARINRSLVQLADEVYGLQLKQLAVGEAAGYEPLQLYAQAVQARTSLAAADATALAAWRQLAALMNQPVLPPAPLVGRVDAVPPDFDLDAILASLPGRHTDLVQARNTVAQAEVNLTLQRRIPIPDLQTNSYYQYDTLAHAFQFGLQFGIAIPIADKNQGNIHAAQARIAQARENLASTQNDLTGRIAEAYGRYSGARVAVTNFRGGVLPNLVRAYRGIIRRYQEEPEKVGFNDIVVAQQNLAQALQSYLSSLDGQWRAAVDLAAAGQLEELYPVVPVPKK